MQPIKWGVLGAAGIAVRKVIPAMQKSEHATVLAIASRSLDKARAAADKLGIERAYGSYEELLHDGDVDAVYIPLPNHLHVPWTIKCADAGKHVLCEKPIALTAAEARTLSAARDRNHVVIGEAFMVRTHPQWLAVRELVRSGELGELKLVSGIFTYNKTDPNDIRSKVEWGGGALYDIGCYPVTIARWLFDTEPEAVTATIERDPDMQVDRLTSGLLRFPDGQAVFTAATQVTPYQRMHIVGTKKRAEVIIPFNAPNDEPLRILVDDGATLDASSAAPFAFPVVDQFELQAAAFARAIRGESPVPVTIEDAIANMAVIDALFEAARTQTWQTPAR